MKKIDIYRAVDEYENPFTGKLFLGHEKCYEEIEKLKRFILDLLKK